MNLEFLNDTISISGLPMAIFPGPISPDWNARVFDPGPALTQRLPNDLFGPGFGSLLCFRSIAKFEYIELRFINLQLQ